MFTVRLNDEFDIFVANGHRGKKPLGIAWVRLEPSKRKHGGLVGRYLSPGDHHGITVIEQNGFTFQGKDGDFALVTITHEATHHLWACHAKLMVKLTNKNMSPRDRNTNPYLFSLNEAPILYRGEVTVEVLTRRFIRDIRRKLSLLEAESHETVLKLSPPPPPAVLCEMPATKAPRILDRVPARPTRIDLRTGRLVPIC